MPWLTIERIEKKKKGKGKGKFVPGKILLAKWSIKKLGMEKCCTEEIHVACPEMTNYAEHLSPEDNGSVFGKKASVPE